MAKNLGRLTCWALRDTLSIDLEAYDRLCRVKKPEESFSQVIKRVVPEPLDIGEWLRGIDETPISGRAGRAIEEKIQSRSRPNRRPR